MASTRFDELLRALAGEGVEFAKPAAAANSNGNTPMWALHCCHNGGCAFLTNSRKYAPNHSPACGAPFALSAD